MYVLYTALDGRDAVVVPGLQYITLPENLKYTYAVSRVSRNSNFFSKRDLNYWAITQIHFDDLPDPVKALIVLYEM